ncbi:MAG: iron-regulated protein [Bacteroidetes bacterium 4572_112]|nr:MAG: iron-regulated protein [Bacteroidetes bacterium 4572_112]
MINFLKKYHKWVSLIFAVIILLFAISGIILNHRRMFSSISIDRSIMPAEFAIKNWNNASVKSTIKLNDSSILIYGNIGIWKTDSLFKDFTDFNNGIRKGIDRKKTCTVFQSSDGSLFAGTLFDLYKYDFKDNKWQAITLPTHERRVVDIIEKDNKLLFLTRSHLIESSMDLSNFNVKELPHPENYDNKVSLFKTLWTIHSGEILGNAGKVFVDFMGLILIFLTITGIILFINKKRLIKRARARKDVLSIVKTNKWNLKWHNKIGWTATFFLIIVSSTGIFLRPPLLIPIADVKVGKIPGSELDSDNAWFDKLRRIIYDDENERFIIATLDGIYYSDDEFASELKRFEHQPPASVMGVNVFHKTASNTYMIGSFEGLFVWNTQSGEIFDYVKKIPYKKPETRGAPIGEYLITAYTNDYAGGEIAFCYNNGAINISNVNNSFPLPPQNILEAAKISLWNVALEIHTGRIYKVFMGIFYILVVPISGFALLFIIISGFIVWWKMYKGIEN